MKKQSFGFLFLLMLVFNISAQTKEARKIDEFGSLDCDELLRRLDNLAEKVMKSTNSKGFVIIYEGKYSRNVSNRGKDELQNFLPRFGESATRIQLMQNHLLNFRSLPKEKFLFVSGGFREYHTVEFWLVPNGANPPKITPTLENMKYRKGEPKNICAGLG